MTTIARDELYAVVQRLIDAGFSAADGRADKYVKREARGYLAAFLGPLSGDPKGNFFVTINYYDRKKDIPCMLPDLPPLLRRQQLTPRQGS